MLAVEPGAIVAGPRISIVVPAYNASRYLDDTIRSIVAQTYGDWELIIVDDGSSDDTIARASAWAQRDQRIRLVTQPNAGVAAARNRGQDAADARSAYMMFVDHDDLLEPNALEALLQLLERHPDAAAACGEFAVVDSGAQPVDRRQFGHNLQRRRLQGLSYVDLDAAEPTTLDVIIASDCILTPGQVLVRRSTIDSEPLFASKFDAYDDWMAWVKVTQHGAMAYTPAPVIRYRMHEQNQSRNVKKLFNGRRAVFRHLMRSAELQPEDRSTAAVAWIYREGGDGLNKCRDGWSALRQREPGGALRSIAQAAACFARVAEGVSCYLRIALTHRGRESVTASAEQGSRAALMRLWRRCVSDGDRASPMETVVAELAEYFRLPPEEVRRRCVNWEQESVEQWHAQDRSSHESVVEFFQTQTSWIFDTMRYHAEQCEGEAFPETVEVAHGLRHLPPGAHLDFGAGPGTSSLFFHALGWKVALADISTSFLDFARWRLARRGIAADFFNTGVDRLPSEAYDLVTAFDVMVHIPNVQSALAEINRVLKPGGYFVFNIDSRPRGPTTEYHFFEAHYPVIRHVRRFGFARNGKIDFFYVYQKTDRTALRAYLVTMYDALRYNELVHHTGNLLRSGRNLLHQLRDRLSGRGR